MDKKLFLHHLGRIQKLNETDHGYSDEFINQKYIRRSDPQTEANKMFKETESFIKTYNVDFKMSKPKVTEGNRTEYNSKGFDVKIEMSVEANNKKFRLEIIKDRWIKDRGAIFGNPQPIRVHYLTINLYDKSGKLIENFGGPKYLRKFTDTFALDVRELTARLNLMLREIYQIPRGTPWHGN